jgi:hypothetical protein
MSNLGLLYFYKKDLTVSRREKEQATKRTEVDLKKAQEKISDSKAFSKIAFALNFRFVNDDEYECGRFPEAKGNLFDIV